MIFTSFHTRSTEQEIMDDFDVEKEELSKALDDITWVNKWLGGNGVSIAALRQWLEAHPQFRQSTLRLVDLGCGNGDTLRRIARWARKEKIQVELTGLDANPNTIQMAREQSDAFPEISFQTADVLSPGFTYSDFDLAHCSLFLHHFEESHIHSLLNKLREDGVVGLLVNDLQRSPLAYYAFALLSWIVGISALARYDGLVSVKKGFRRKELENMFAKARMSAVRIHWKWAFRYQITSSFSS